MIDITKPLELEDGRSCTFSRVARSDCFQGRGRDYYMVGIKGVPGYKAFNKNTGKHVFHEYPNLRNKIMKVVDVNKPVTVGGKEAKIIHVFDNGNLAVVVDGWAEVQNYNQYGQANGEGAIILVNAATVTEQWINVYPAPCTCYTYRTKADADNARGKANPSFQVKQTLHDGVVVSSEVVV